jgi:hypothetical protein
MHLNDDELVLHYYGETEGADDQRAAAHLGECDACRGSFSRLQRVLAAVDAAPDPVVLPEGFERTVWARLEPGLAGQRRTWLSWFVFSPARVAWAAAVVVLVAGAFLAGRRSQQDPSSTRSVAAAADMREQILMVDLSEHLDRSQMMLVDLVSAADGDVDMSAERERAENLVAANRLYRQTAGQTGDAAVAELLDELERVLVELAASPDTLSAEDIESVRQRIEAKGLLFKVRVLSSSVRERQKQQVRTRAGQSS